jgi:hypothetical protein
MQNEPSITMQRMSIVFNEWAKRAAANPEDFGSIFDANGVPVEDYGDRSAILFNQIAAELDADGKLPRPTL